MQQLARNTHQIGAAIRRNRRNQKLTQTELGQKTSLRQATISRLENGEPAVQLQTLVDVLAALNLELVIQQRTTDSDNRFEDIF